MTKGAEYTASAKKRGFDLMVANSMRPALAVARFAVTTEIGPDLSPVIVEQRIGQNEKPYDIYKLWTPGKNQEGSDWLKKFEKLGIDELAQIKNIIEGTMHVGGRRGLNDEHQQYVLDTMSSKYRDPWLRVVRQNRTGILSRYGFHFHFHPVLDPNESDIRAEYDIYDAAHDSLTQDIAFIGTLLKLGVQRGLR